MQSPLAVFNYEALVQNSAAMAEVGVAKLFVSHWIFVALFAAGLLIAKTRQRSLKASTESVLLTALLFSSTTFVAALLIQSVVVSARLPDSVPLRFQPEAQLLAPVLTGCRHWKFEEAMRTHHCASGEHPAVAIPEQRFERFDRLAATLAKRKCLVPLDTKLGILCLKEQSEPQTLVDVAATIPGFPSCHSDVSTATAKWEGTWPKTFEMLHVLKLDQYSELSRPVLRTPKAVMFMCKDGSSITELDYNKALFKLLETL